MINIWQNPKSFKPNQLRKALTKQLTNKYKLTWLSEMEAMSSCVTYKTFKSELKLERYLMLPDCVDRINISKFRCRNSKIPVVTLGYRDVYPMKTEYAHHATWGLLGTNFIILCNVLSSKCKDKDVSKPNIS